MPSGTFERMIRIGIDVGGTFTDLVAMHGEGQFVRLKVATTPREPEIGALAAFAAYLERDGDAGAIGLIAHASTIATNALLGQMHLELPRVAFVTTGGFRDVLEIGRQNRSAIYDLNVKRPTPLARREDRFAIAERRDVHGNVLVAPSADEVDAVAAEIERRGIETIAIGFLHADVDDAHEKVVAERLAAALPAAHISRSAEVVREFREYERFSTAVVNAALMPIVRRYLDRFVAGIRAHRIDAPIFAMRSDGGMASIDAAARRPASLIESGPASGVIAAAFLGSALGLGRVLSFDMGGTTAKAGTILDGKAEISSEFEAAGATHSGRAMRGSGYPVRFPFVDLAEVSAGGGTIAWIDRAGSLRVGPTSAGADPGPAAYGRGTSPTVTDANVVLGRLNPRALLGGTFPIDARNALRALERIASATEGDPVRAAAGIVALVDSEMSKVLRIVSVERGFDPRDFTMIAFGGGGPLHACAVAREIGVRSVIVPALPGLFSAYGLLAADVRVTPSRTLVAPLDATLWPRVDTAFDELSAEAERDLIAQGVAPKDRAYTRELDLRYAGQSFELTVAFEAPDDTARAFHDRHERRYGFAARDEPVEIVTLRVNGVGRTEKPRLEKTPGRCEAGPPKPEALLETRAVHDGAAFLSTNVYAREHLHMGAIVAGPAVIEQYDSTTFVAAGWTAAVDAFGNLRLESDSE